MASPTTATLPANHFLSLPRPTFLEPQLALGTPDVGTLAGADYDVDVRTGFMPPTAPVKRLPHEFEIWESTLDVALASRLRVGDVAGTTSEDWARAELWRETVRSLPVLPVTSILYDVLQLRRAHQVLTSLMHFYVHSAAPRASSDGPAVIPSPLSIPLITVSHELGIAPILTYADTVLWNWSPTDPSAPLTPATIQSYPLFSATPSEAHFYLVSAQIELRGVEALDIMRSSLDEAFVGDAIAIRRITSYLDRLAKVIDEITGLLMTMRDGCEPNVFYYEVRPWFRGSNGSGRDWLYEGVDPIDALTASSLSGPSAGQSTLIHAFDVFLGVDHTSPHPPLTTSPTTAAPPPSEPTFMTRMESYMPGPHRRFLHNLRDAANPIRPLVQSTESLSPLQAAYDNAVLALKRFRDAHIRIVTLYIINPSRAGTPAIPVVARPPADEKKPLRGTGGTALVPFLKETRRNTERAMLGQKEAR